MVNDLADLMREASGQAPPEAADLSPVLRRGRQRVRRRRAGIVGGASLAVGAITLASMTWLNPSPPDLAAAGVPNVSGPSVRLTDAQTSVEGTDHRVLASYTNENLNDDNGQYFEGVTDDGLILFRDGPRMDQLWPRYALMDPASGEKEWLPRIEGVEQDQLWPLELSADRLVLLGTGGGGMEVSLLVHVFDRGSGAWTTMTWPGLPRTDSPFGAVLGPADRLYVRVPATQGKPPEGGWPTGPDGEADDADAEGDTYDLWSASLTDATDVRDEGLRVGAVGFTDDAMVWTDSSNGAAGQVHVRDLATGEETSFDPRLGEKCNLLGLSVAGERIAMSQYCGTYEGGVRDDRVQVMTLGGEQVVTIQDDGVDGGRLTDDGGLMTMSAYGRATGGTYVYDFETERLLRLSDGHSPWAAPGGPAPGDMFMWNTPAGGKVPDFGQAGATTWLGELL
ncbi:hypothetical protein EXE58_12195 [Nocardioides seonyuensis]|uniref:WD40 repeat domain-containing protein n=1 Tax=Nocardioides seonyuensis TaxID=2518371 RepID=A0A4P7IJU7_9ACTN|nr:hypothetical protein [Nocardioides seonyuensis]QBX56151.1 hypothetical protein EXE58_12195 [Nocardioides seonyuensis]